MERDDNWRLLQSLVSRVLVRLQRAVTLENASYLAFRERTGREPVDGDIIMPEDDARAAEIVENFYPKGR
jgi:hypothetical protein